MTSLRRMGASEFSVWKEQAIPAYASDKVASGQWSHEASLDVSRREFEELLPNDHQTPDNHFFTILDEHFNTVGTLWFAVKTKFSSRIAYVFDVQVFPQYQRKGHASGAFVALEVEVHKLGLTGIALHVFGHNIGARALYEELGFAPTNISLFKSVGAAGA
jgi:ribosomal protein S18 acetylase RimI-like enzyme